MTILSEMGADLLYLKDAIKKKWDKLPPSTRKRIEKKFMSELKKIVREEFDKYMKRRRKK